MAVEIPDKLYFKIGEVAEIAGVKPHVLRYWESEFSGIRPVKSSSQQRLYRRKDIELVLRLKGLLYDQGFTIAGAKKQIRAAASGSAAAERSGDRTLLEEIRNDLLRLRESLGDSRR